MASGISIANIKVGFGQESFAHTLLSSLGEQRTSLKLIRYLTFFTKFWAYELYRWMRVLLDLE